MEVTFCAVVLAFTQVRSASEFKDIWGKFSISSYMKEMEALNVERWDNLDGILRECNGSRNCKWTAPLLNSIADVR